MRTLSCLAAPLLLAATAAAQNPDLVLTFSLPERTLSGSGGTVLQSLMPNEVSHLAYVTSLCPVSAEKWAPRTAYHTMAGDENGDGLYWNPTLFGPIDALTSPPPVATASGGNNPRTEYWSVSTPIGGAISATPFRPGDVARIVRTGLGDGQVQFFMRQEQFNMALGLPPATPIDVDAVAFGPNHGVWFSLDTDIFAPGVCGGVLVRDGDILCVPPVALTYTPDLRIGAVAVGSAVVVYNEAQVDAMVVNAAVADRFGACVPNAVDLEALEIDFNGPMTAVVTCSSFTVAAPPLLFATETMTGASLLTTLGGGTIYNTPCGPAGTSCGAGPTFGNQLGLMPPTAATGVASHVNAIASARTFRNVLEPQQHVMNVFPFGAPAGAIQIDYGTVYPVSVVFVEIVPPTVPGSVPAFPFSQLCFPDIYATSLTSYGPVFGPWGSFPMLAIPPMWAGKVLFQSVGIGGSGFELSTPTVIDVQ